MKKNNQNLSQNQEPEIDRSGIDFRSDADTAINSSSLSNQDLSGDEASLVDAMGQNGFKLFLLRTFIKVKNHISIIPMIMVVITMMIITFTIQVHVNACVDLRNNKFNAFFFFLNIICSMLAVLCYININSKKVTKKKWIVMMVLFYLIIGFEIYLDISYLRDINIQLNLVSSKNLIVDGDKHWISRSYGYTFTHLIFLFIDAILAALAPVVQPFTKKIQIHIKKKKAE